VIEKDEVQELEALVENNVANDQGIKKRKNNKISQNKHVLENTHLDFIDNVKEIVTRKDIIPKFYDGDLSALLTRTIIIVFLTATVTVSKLVFGKQK